MADKTLSGLSTFSMVSPRYKNMHNIANKSIYTQISNEHNLKNKAKIYQIIFTGATDTPRHTIYKNGMTMEK